MEQVLNLKGGQLACKRWFLTVQLVLFYGVKDGFLEIKLDVV